MLKHTKAATLNPEYAFQSRSDVLKQILFFTACFFVFFSGVMPGTGHAAQVTLAWKNNHPAPRGYRVYKAPAGGSYDFSVPDWQGPDPRCTLTGLDAGKTYRFVVRSYCDDGVSGNSNEVSYTTKTENRPPTADAGANQSVSVGDAVRLNGDGSSDPEGSALAYRWSQTAGPVVKLTDPARARAGFTAPMATAATRLSFRLTVTDAGGLSAEDTCHVTVTPAAQPNQPPIADAGPDQTATAGQLVRLDGGGSTDHEGPIRQYRWTQTAGPIVTLNDPALSAPSFTALQVTDTTLLSFSLAVTDAGGLTASDACDITVMPAAQPNQPPIANAGPDISAVSGTLVQLDGGASTDPEGAALAYRWSQTSGPAVKLSDPACAQPGFTTPLVTADTRLSFRLIVTDAGGLTAADTCDVAVAPAVQPNQPPVANAGPDSSAVSGTLVQLDGGASTDPEGAALAYRWSQTSGPAVKLSDPACAQPGFTTPLVTADTRLSFRLTVTDAGGLTAADTCDVAVAPAVQPNQPPIANAGPDLSAVSGTLVQLDGGASMDPENKISQYEWRCTAGPSVDLVNANTAAPTFTAPLVKTATPMSFTLTVTDNGGLRSTDTCHVTIEPEALSNQPPTAEAGSNQTVAGGGVVHLNGSGSRDPEGERLRFQWVRKSGPVVVLKDAATPWPSFTAPVDTAQDLILVFELTVTDSVGLTSADTCVVMVTAAKPKDTDGDGVPDDTDAFPNDKSEWKDSDQDGTGDNADTDDDNDGMPDDWENRHGLDPLRPDADEDPDGDGKTNIDEYREGTNPQSGNDANHPPETPSLTYPFFAQTGVPLAAEIKACSFSDPDEDDTHVQTGWQVIEYRTNRILLDVKTDGARLKALTVPRMVLNPSTNYMARARFFDNHGTPSAWSAMVPFKTMASNQDLNSDGIPDHQEMDAGADMNADGIADSQQGEIIKGVFTAEGRRQVSICIGACESATAITHVTGFDLTDLENSPAGRQETPFGLLGFKIILDEPGASAAVTLFYSEPLAGELKWLRHDAFKGWETFTEGVNRANDNRSIVYHLQDGGDTDGDGTVNGIIVDVSGPRIIQNSPPDGDQGDGDTVPGGGGGGGSSGCFIRSLLTH